MRILVCPKNLELGGSQESAAVLADGLARLGEEVIVAGPAGPLDVRIGEGPATRIWRPPGRSRVSDVVGRARLLRRVRPDVVVAFEYPGILEAATASALARTGTPVAGVIHATRVPWFLPESVCLSVAREELRRFTRRWWPGPVHLLPPPIDEPAPPRSSWAAAGGSGPPRLVVVSRLVESFKAEGIVRSIEAMPFVADGAELTIAGDGPARPRFEGAAREVNAALGREVVRFVGPVAEPGELIRDADVVLGSGMSILHGLAAGVPCLVIGRDGFATEVDPGSLTALRDAGFYGAGGDVTTPQRLAELIDGVAGRVDAERRRMLREAVLRDYGARAVTTRFRDHLVAVTDRSAPTTSEMVRALGRRWYYRWCRARLRRAVPADRSTPEQVDDFVYGRLREMPVHGRRFTGRRGTPQWPSAPDRASPVAVDTVRT